MKGIDQGQTTLPFVLNEIRCFVEPNHYTVLYSAVIAKGDPSEASSKERARGQANSVSAWTDRG
jgi:hypothetical protein